MKLSFLSLDNEIIFSNEHISVLEIHNKTLFTNIVMSFYKSLSKEEGQEKFKLLVNHKEVPFYSNAIVLTDYFNADFATRVITNKLNKKATSFLSDTDFYRDLEFKISKINADIISELFDLSPNLSYNDLSIDSFIKSLNLKISINEGDLISQLKSIVETISLLELGRLLVCVNLKSFLNDKELEEFYNYTKSHNLNLLLLENASNYKLLKYESKLIIEEDLYETMIN